MNVPTPISLDNTPARPLPLRNYSHISFDRKRSSDIRFPVLVDFEHLDLPVLVNDINSAPCFERAHMVTLGYDTVRDAHSVGLLNEIAAGNESIPVSDSGVNEFDRAVFGIFKGMFESTPSKQQLS